MALTPNLITEAEADLALPIELYPEWNLLSTVQKDNHIRNASTYTRLTWSCSDEDFVTPNLSDDAKHAVALYAEADRAGNLYASASTSPPASGGALTELKLKAGSVEKTEKWSDTITKRVTSPLKQADDIFGMIGCVMKRGGTSVSLARN